MLQPVGKLPPAVYWRRRLVFVVAPAILIVLLFVYLVSGDDDSPGRPVASASSPKTSAGATAATQASPNPSGLTSPAITATTPSAAVDTGRACSGADLKVEAATGQPTYPVNSRPDLYLVVTNISATPCRQDLADPQIVLTITAGDVRVWGSHDCGITQGVEVALLSPAAAVRRGIVWSGLTSVPGCSGNRLVSQAGTYDLVAGLAGKNSDKIQFQLT